MCRSVLVACQSQGVMTGVDGAPVRSIVVCFQVELELACVIFVCYIKNPIWSCSLTVRLCVAVKCRRSQHLLVQLSASGTPCACLVRSVISTLIPTQPLPDELKASATIVQHSQFRYAATRSILITDSWCSLVFLRPHRTCSHN